MTIETVVSIMERYDEVVAGFRLSGDAEKLKFLIEEAIRADSLILVDNFSNDLTESEKQAYHFITEELNSQNGYISVVKMIQKSNISRPVYTSLLAKMEKFGIAQIKNCGMKGTLIEWNKTSLNK